MSAETKPVISSDPAPSTATVSDLMSQLRTTFLSTDFQKMEKIFTSREEEMKTRISELSTAVDGWKMRYLSKESEHGILYLKHLTMEEELNKYKTECQAMRAAKAKASAERDREVKELNEEVSKYKADCKAMEAKVEALVDRDREVRELNEKVEVLSCGNVRAEVRFWVKKYNELVVRISKLEDRAEEVCTENSLFRKAVEGVTGVFGKKMEVENGSPKSVGMKPKCGVSNYNGDEMSPGAGSIRCDSHRKEHVGSQEGAAYSFDATCGNGGANRKQLVSRAESFNKLMEKSLAGGKQPQSTEIIEIDSEDEMDATSIRNVRASGLKSGEKRKTPELVVEGSGQTGMSNAVNVIENPILALGSKWKQPTVVLSENNNRDYDNGPIGKQKVKRLQELGNVSQASPVNSCVATPSLVLGNTGVSTTSYKPGLGCSNTNAVSPTSCIQSMNGRTGAAVSPASGKAGFITPCTEKLKANLCSRIPSYHSDSSNSEDENDSDQCMDDFITSFQRQKEKSGWAFQADMLQAFETDDELCLNAVCALHRQSNSKDNSRGFELVDALRGTALAKFLIDGDQHGKLRKSVSELQQHDPKGLEYCRKLAVRYSISLFDVYQKKEDPFFCPPLLKGST